MSVKRKLKPNDGIEELHFLTRTYSTLKRNDYDLIQDITAKCACELQKIDGVGWKTLEDVIDRLRENSFNLSECNAYKQED